MEEFVRGNVGKRSAGGNVDRRGIGVLHASAAAVCRFADMKDECVLGIRRAVHEFYFVGADFAERGLDVVPPVIVAVNDHVHGRSQVVKREFLKVRNFNWSIRKSIKGWSLYCEQPSTAHRLEEHTRGGSDNPFRGDIIKRESILLGAAIGDIKKNHCWIDEGVIGIKLRAERAGIVPKSVVGNLEGAARLDAPGELVEFFDGRRLAVHGGRDALNVAAEIANFVKSVPSGHLELHMILYIRDFHSDMEEMLLGMKEGDGVTNLRFGSRRDE